MQGNKLKNFLIQKFTTIKETISNRSLKTRTIVKDPLFKRNKPGSFKAEH